MANASARTASVIEQLGRRDYPRLDREINNTAHLDLSDKKIGLEELTALVEFLRGKELLSQVRILTFSAEHQFPTTGLALLVEFTAVETLSLSIDELDDAEAQHLAGLRCLSTLYLWNCRTLTDTGLLRLKILPFVNYIILGGRDQTSTQGRETLEQEVNEARRLQGVDNSLEVIWSKRAAE